MNTEEARAALFTRLQTIDSDNRQLREDNEDLMHINDRLNGLLEGVALALKGPNPPNWLHSFHDLPELAQAMINAPDAVQLTALYWTARGCELSEWPALARDILKRKISNA